ncbi:MAG: hypothetical protein KAH84_00065 [Thiomargarita sp.]|nr:hypothetical protein [Thiomargarita sp.]
MKFDATFFENRACKYYPCHTNIKHINCLFCYCPLYFLDCPGNYTMLKLNNNPTILEKSAAIKDCSQCTVVHNPKTGWKTVQKYIGLKMNK